MSGQHPEDQNKANPFVTGNEYRQPPQQQKSTSTWVIVAIVGASSIFVMLFCGGIFMGLTLPAVQVAREAARRMSCSNNMKEIGIALHNYHSAYGSLPPAYTVDDQGRPLHSWRTLILPFLEQQALYEQIDLSKPWDDPVNAAIAAIAVPTYMCPSAAEPSAFTSYVAVLDPDGMMMGDRPIRFQDVTDGLSNTVMIVEIEPRAGGFLDEPTRHHAPGIRRCWSRSIVPPHRRLACVDGRRSRQIHYRQPLLARTQCAGNSQR